MASKLIAVPRETHTVVKNLIGLRGRTMGEVVKNAMDSYVNGIPTEEIVAHFDRTKIKVEV